MDVGVNKPFKNYVRNEFYDWLVNNNHCKPKRYDVATWIKGAWDTMTEDIMKNSFRGSGYKADDDVEGVEVVVDGPSDGNLYLVDPTDAEEVADAEAAVNDDLDMLDGDEDDDVPLYKDAEVLHG